MLAESRATRCIAQGIVSAWLTVAAACGWAQEAQRNGAPSHTFDIRESTLSSALIQFSRQSNTPIVFSDRLTRHHPRTGPGWQPGAGRGPGTTARQQRSQLGADRRPHYRHLRAQLQRRPLRQPGADQHPFPRLRAWHGGDLRLWQQPDRVTDPPRSQPLQRPGRGICALGYRAQWGPDSG